MSSVYIDLPAIDVDISEITGLPEALALLVPYAGATGDVNLGSNTLTVRTIYLPDQLTSGGGGIDFKQGRFEFSDGASSPVDIRFQNAFGSYFRFFDSGVADYALIQCYDGVYDFFDANNSGGYAAIRASSAYASTGSFPSVNFNSRQAISPAEDILGDWSGDNWYMPHGFFGGVDQSSSNGGFLWFQQGSITTPASFQFISNDVNDEWGGGVSLNMNPEEGVSLSSQSSSLYLNAGGFGITAAGVAAIQGDSGGATVYATQGSASLPSYSFLGDTNTGMYSVSGDTIGFTTGGVAQMFIGNAAISMNLPLGVGTVNASTEVNSLLFTAGISTAGSLRLRSTKGIGVSDTILFQVGNNGATEAGRIVTSGRWGLKGITAPTATLHLPAGLAAASSSPLKFTSGALNTTAEVGAVEFLTDSFYVTITTGAARKEITLNDTALTSGRVPFSTTNGRLTDDSDFTFATDTLTVTKIAATTYTGNQTYTAVNLVFDTTTGSKIGTATTQKLSLWNATPIVQPANTVAIDTLLVNMGARASGGVSLFDTDVKLSTVGTGLYVKEGTNATLGTATLVAGTVTISTTKITANSRIFYNIQGGTLTNLGVHYVSARTAGTSFVISSLNILDASTIAWFLVEPS